MSNSVKIKNAAKLITGIGGGLAGSAALITDVLSPLAPFGLYIAIILFIGLLVSLILFFIPKTNSQKKYQKIIKERKRIYTYSKNTVLPHF